MHLLYQARLKDWKVQRVSHHLHVHLNHTKWCIRPYNQTLSQNIVLFREEETGQ